MSNPIDPFLVRIYRSGGGVIGAGFLVNLKPALVCTCAHVIGDALGLEDMATKPTDAVDIDFPFHNGRKKAASVDEPWLPPDPTIPDDGRDIAVLRLADADLPTDARPAPLVNGGATSGRHWDAYGFPVGHDPGIWAQGITVGEISNHTVQMEVRHFAGHRVEAGFSGTPVWAQQAQGVIGMVVQAEMNEQTRVSFFIPTEELVRADPRLHGREYRDEHDERNVPMSFSAPPQSEHWIGRDELLGVLKRRLRVGVNGDKTTEIVLLQTPGVGKTEVAAHLANDPDVRAYFQDRILWTALGRKPNVNATLAELARQVGLSAEAIAMLTSKGACLTAIRNRIATLGLPVLLIVDDVWEGQDAVNLRLQLSNCRQVLTTRRLDVASNFAPEKHEFIGPLNADDSLTLLETMAGQALRTKKARDRARELVLVLGGLPLALVLVGRYLRRASYSGQAHQIDAALNRLRKAEARLELEQPRPLGRPEDAPLSLQASIRVSEEALDDATRRVFRTVSLFHPKPGSFSVRAAAAMREAEDEDRCRASLDQLFDAGLLEAVPDIDTGQPDSELDGAEPDDVGPMEAERRSDKFMMPRTIADYARTYFDGYELDAEHLHRLAAGYYLSCLEKYEETRSGDATSYERMYSYEDKDWQGVASAWLYHLGHIDPADANPEFARTYFDAFWWWGNYCPFPFCERLIAEWREWGERWTSPDGRLWLAPIEDFHRAYPIGYDKRGKGDWAAVERALREVRRLGDLDGELAALADDRRRHLRAITDLFLAEAYRYRDPQDPRAEQTYLEALALFGGTDADKNGATDAEGSGDGGPDREGTRHGGVEDEGDEDAWNVPWVLWHLADLALERAQPERALDRAEEALRLVKHEDLAERDNEVMANVERVRADVYWQRGALDAAFRAYARALLCAYAFQAYPHAADFYTMAFYGEMIARTMERLDELWDRGQRREALRACAALRAFWQPYWEREAAGGAEVPEGDGTTRGVPAGDVSVGDIEGTAAALLAEGRRHDLAAHLFPAMLSEQDMMSEEIKQEYAHQTQRVVKAMIDSTIM